MSLFTLIKNVAAKRLDKAMANQEHRPERTPVPMGMHQGSVVQVPELDLALAQADGSILPRVLGDQRIVSVGTQTIFGQQVYNCYLADGTSFLRVVANRNEAREIYLYVARDEILPQTSQDWEFWLGRWGKDEQGRARLEEAGLVGWPQFQIDGPPQIVYNRAWNPGDAGILPVAYTETIVDLDGTMHKVKHEAMEYVRTVGGGDNPTRESLLVSLASCGNDASVDIFVGIPLTIRDLRILAAN